jgi:putative nucleotidyltransferase with HDIG domain
MKLNDFILCDNSGNPVDVNWKFVETIPQLTALKNCQQSTKWHSEGNAFIHTQHVVKHMLERLKTDNSFVVYPYHAKVLVCAALFHDLGKATTTEFKKNDWHSYGHEVESERITREMLWDEEFDTREAICALVAMHMEPLFYNKNNWFKKMCNATERLERFGPYSVADLILLKWADTIGSTPSVEGKNDKDIKFLNELFDALGDDKSVYEKGEAACYNKLRAVNFLNIYNKIDSIIRDFTEDESENKKKSVTAIVLIGLPGSGKNWWYEHNFQKMFPDKSHMMISRDDIRIQLGFCKEGEKYLGSNREEEEVTRIFNNSVKTAAATNDIVIINNTNLRRKYRDQYKELLEKLYNVTWVYVYTEAEGLSTNILRREGQIPANQFSAMTRKFDWPVPDEYDDFIIVHSGTDVERADRQK